MPLDLSLVKSVVETNIERLMREFGIAHWRIEVVYTRLQNARAEVETGQLGSYERAEIRFDPMSCTSEEQVLATLEHELLHIVMFPMEQYCRTIDEVLPDEVRKLDQELWRHQSEQMIRNLERLVWGIRNAREPPKDTS